MPGSRHETAAKSSWSKLGRPVVLDGGKHQSAGGPARAAHWKQLTKDVIRGLFFLPCIKENNQSRPGRGNGQSYQILPRLHKTLGACSATQ